MQARHTNRKQYFEEQSIVTEKYVIPYIKELMPIDASTRVLEIGCGEGGNIPPFLRAGCSVVGIDLNKKQIENARIFLQEMGSIENVELLCQDIYDVDSEKIGRFDLIIMRDVIEHIHNQERFMAELPRFLNEGGKIFFGFPPWRMPFGGHQQICASKLLSKLPYFHLLPKILYVSILKIFGEKPNIVDSLIEIKETGISIARFENIVHKNGYVFLKQTPYLINPNYEIKFGLKPTVQSKIVNNIPYFRDFLTTCYYCVIAHKS